MTTALDIIRSLFPVLVESARYADLLQHRIEALEDKDSSNLFAAALSDADVSIQTHIEIALLAHFPRTPLFGEEWKSSRNTKYLIGTGFVPDSPFLVTLDPIDGTRPYLDGHKLYQIILTVISRDAFEGAIVLFPSYGDYVYALRGKGAFRGTLGTPLEDAKPFGLGTPPPHLFLSSAFPEESKRLRDRFPKVDCSGEYHRDTQMTLFSSLLRTELSGAVIEAAQVIDGAALAFVAHEMGYLVKMFDGSALPRPEDYPDLVFPGVIVAKDAALWQELHSAVQR